MKYDSAFIIFYTDWNISIKLLIKILQEIEKSAKVPSAQEWEETITRLSQLSLSNSKVTKQLESATIANQRLRL